MPLDTEVPEFSPTCKYVNNDKSSLQVLWLRWQWALGKQAGISESEEVRCTGSLADRRCSTNAVLCWMLTSLS